MNSDSKADRLASIILLIGDLIALGLFVYLGETDHAVNDPQPVLRWLVTTGEFALPWIIAAWVLGAYTSGLSVKAILGRSLNAWLVAAPMGVLLRSFVNGSGTIISLFLVVATCAGGVMLLGWRLIFTWFWRTRTARSRAKAQPS